MKENINRLEENMNTTLNAVHEERGVALVSYVVLVACIAIVAVLGVSRIGRNVDDRFTDTNEALTVEQVSGGDADGQAAVDEPSDPDAEIDAAGTPTSDAGGSSYGDSGGSGSGDTGATGSPTVGGGSPPSSEGTGDATPIGDGSSADDESPSDGGTAGSGGSTGTADPGDPGGSGGAGGTTVGGGDDGSGPVAPGAGSGAPIEGESDEASYDQSETVGVFGQFSVTFAVVDGRVVVGSVAATGWRYEVTKDNGKQIQMRFTNFATGEKKLVKGWLTGSGKLKASVN